METRRPAVDRARLRVVRRGGQGRRRGSAARTVLGRSRGSFAFQAPETRHAPISMGLPESLQLFDETRVKGP
jgi:hypothetical protein